MNSTIHPNALRSASLPSGLNSGAEDADVGWIFDAGECPRFEVFDRVVYSKIADY